MIEMTKLVEWRGNGVNEMITRSGVERELNE